MRFLKWKHFPYGLRGGDVARDGAFVSGGPLRTAWSFRGRRVTMRMSRSRPRARAVGRPVLSGSMHPTVWGELLPVRTSVGGSSRPIKWGRRGIAEAGGRFRRGGQAPPCLPDAAKDEGLATVVSEVMMRG